MNSKVIFWLTLLIPGSGQLINKQFKKAILGLVFFVLSWLTMILSIIPNLSKLFVTHSEGEYQGMTTIGKTPWTPGLLDFDDSFLILIGAIFGIVLIAIFIFINYGFARDAMKVKQAIENHEEIISVKKRLKSVAPDLIPHMVTAPAFIMMIIFMVIPAIVSIFIAFTNYRDTVLPPAFLIEWVGFENFKALFVDPELFAVFQETAVWTLIWTFSATTLTIALGIFLAILTHNKKIKGKKFFRTIYLLPWAVPAFLTILVFQIFFSTVGTMNTVVIPFFTGNEYQLDTAIEFLLNPDLAKVTIILIQAWLGFPFVYVLTTGVLQAIPEDLYEAAKIDGGNAWTCFWDITFPMIMIAAAPMLITQYTFNFNNVTIIYLLGESVVKPVGATYGPLETIASLGFQLTLDAEFSRAAVFTLIVSVIVSIVVIISWIKTGAFTNEEVM